jgi:Mitochondrial carrier protein
VALGVLRNEGILGFWLGNGLNVLRTAPYKVGTQHLQYFPLFACW